MIVTNNIVNEIKDFVSEFLQNELPDIFYFHNFEHAKYVAEKSGFIGEKCGLDTNQINIAKISAWFHDTGYAIDPNNHEKESAKIAEMFLIEKGIEPKIIDLIKTCIFATKIDVEPPNLISKVLCDADLMHLTEDDYFERIKKMRKEWKSLSEKKISKKSFIIYP